VQFTAREEVRSDTTGSAEPPDPVSWKATLGIIGVFFLGVTLTQPVDR
jgi:hypothetical protein